jgi:hypothetical protein
LTIRLDNSFKRLKHTQKKLSKGIRNPSHKKKENPNTINWQASDAFKREKKGQFKKGKGKKLQNNFKCFNCGKLKHYTRDCYSKPKQNKTARPENEIQNQKRNLKKARK